VGVKCHVCSEMFIKTDFAVIDKWYTVMHFRCYDYRYPLIDSGYAKDLLSRYLLKNKYS
jgi:hypothetical protein